MGTPSTAEPSEETSSTEEVAPGRLSTDQERAMYLGIARTRRDMLAGREDALAKVEVERHRVLMAGRDFDRAVCEARAEGFAWEHIVEHVPGFKTARRGGREAVRVDVGLRRELRRTLCLVALW